MCAYRVVFFVAKIPFEMNITINQMRGVGGEAVVCPLYKNALTIIEVLKDFNLQPNDDNYRGLHIAEYL